MIPRIGFALEQALGHVAYGQGLKQALGRRSDLDCEWLEVPFGRDGFGRVPAVGANWTLRGSLRAQRLVARAHQARPLRALFIHTQTIGLFSAGHMRRIPTLLSLDATPKNYDELAHFYGDSVHPDLVERAKLKLHAAVMRNAQRLTSWSQWAKDSLVRDYGVPADRITVIHPGTVLSNYPAPSERTPRRDGPLRVLFVGGDFERKGGDLLLEAVRGPLRDQIELHLVTSAPVAEGPGVHVYRGLKPHSKELLQRYAEADVFALPTRGDCLAVVLGEAMASGLPIITTRVGAHAEAVEDEVSGFLMQPDDRATLVDRLGRLARDRELGLRLGRRSREIGEDRFDMQKNADRIASMLLELAGAPS